MEAEGIGPNGSLSKEGVKRSDLRESDHYGRLLEFVRDVKEISDKKVGVIFVDMNRLSNDPDTALSMVKEIEKAGADVVMPMRQAQLDLGEYTKYWKQYSATRVEIVERFSNRDAAKSLRAHLTDEQKTYQEEVTKLTRSIRAKIGKPESKLRKWIEGAVDRGGNRNNSKEIKFRTTVETHLDLATLTDVKGAEKQAEMYLKEVKNDVEVDDAEAHKTRNVLYCRMSSNAKLTDSEIVEINGKAVGGLSVNQIALAYTCLQHGKGMCPTEEDIIIYVQDKRTRARLGIESLCEMAALGEMARILVSNAPRLS